MINGSLVYGDNGYFGCFGCFGHLKVSSQFEVRCKLLMPEYKDKLAEVLKYHVVSGAAVKSTDLRFFQKVPTLNGQELRVLRFFRLVVVNQTYVILANVMATNGVIHAIDEVLIPEGFSLEDPVEPTNDIVDTAVAANFSTLVTAVQAPALKMPCAAPVRSRFSHPPTRRSTNCRQVLSQSY